MTERVVAVVPVFNEAASVGAVVAGVRRVCPIVVVDDASNDASGAQAAAAGADCVIAHGRRAGKAAALRTGFAEALRRGADLVASLDGDGQHDPADLPRLLSAAHREPRALVVGDRLSSADGDPSPRMRLAAIQAASRALAWLTGVPIRDTQCGFRIYPAALLRSIVLRGEGFVLETEALVRAVRAGYAPVSVPVRRIYLPGRASRFRALPDGGRIGWYIARELGRQLGHRLAAGGPPGVYQVATGPSALPRVEPAP